MGRFPTHYKGKEIVFRLPFTMGVETTVGVSTPNSVFPLTDLSHTDNPPFEVHGLIIRATTYDLNGDMIEPQQTTLPCDIQVRITDASTSINLTSRIHRVYDLGKNDEREWTWDEPRTIEKTGGFRITVDTGTMAAVSVVPPTAVVFVRVEITFLGYKLLLAGQEACETARKKIAGIMGVAA